MFTRTHTQRVNPDEMPDIITVTDGGFPQVVQAHAVNSEGWVCSAVETTILAPGYFIPEFTFIPLPPCGHTRCSDIKMGVVLN